MRDVYRGPHSNLTVFRCLKSKNLLYFCGLFFCAVLASSSFVSAAEGKPNIVLIYDSSRSMWGQIDGVNKVVSLRNVLSETFKRYDGRLNVGLVSYGHRKSVGCKDIEALHPLGPLKADDYAKKVVKTVPKGSTPIADSLNFAAKMGKPGSPLMSIILVSDGLDNCKANPCGAAQALHKKLPDLKIHVVAFDRNNLDKLKALSCISQITGGQFYPASNEKELQIAVDNAMESNLLTTAAASAAPPAKADTSQLPKFAPQQPDGPSNQQGRPGVSSWNFATEIAKTGIGSPAANSSGKAEKPVKLAARKAGKSAKGDKSPKSGKLVPVSLSALIKEGGRQIRSGLVWRIFDAEPGTDGNYTLRSSHRNANPTAALPPGEYLINVAYGRAHLTKKVTVTTGKSVNEIFVLNTGGLRMNAVLANGERIPMNNVKFAIYSDERDQFGNRNLILNNAKPNLIIRLNAGIYHIVSKYGNANAKVSADVTVEPGKLTEATINHNASKITFKLVLQPGGEALANTQWSVLSATGEVVKESVGALPTHILAAGQYTVLAKHNGQSYRRDFDVAPSEVKQVEVVIQ